MNTILTGIDSIAFPAACMACGAVLENQKQVLCPSCVKSRFEDPNPMNHPVCSDTILPEGFRFQDAMWRYDKAGVIQEMIRMLKYHGMENIGSELGRIAGKRVYERHFGNFLPVDPEEVLLVPVPLHPGRKKMRGYNQARLIAEGISEITGVKVAAEETIIRTKNTITQTKFSFSKRMENLRNVFKVTEPDHIKSRFSLIIDDVFTTGSTTFSLGNVLRNAGAERLGILTVGIA